MKLIYVMCLSLAATSLAVHAYSGIDSVDSEEPHTRFERSILDDDVLYKCPLGYFRVRQKCVSCEEHGIKLGRPMKLCFGRCVHVRQPCPEGRNDRWKTMVPDVPYNAGAASHRAGPSALILPGLIPLYARFAGM